MEWFIKVSNGIKINYAIDLVIEQNKHSSDEIKRIIMTFDKRHSRRVSLINHDHGFVRVIMESSYGNLNIEVSALELFLYREKRNADSRLYRKQRTDKNEHINRLDDLLAKKLKAYEDKRKEQSKRLKTTNMWDISRLYDEVTYSERMPARNRYNNRRKVSNNSYYKINYPKE